MELVSSQASKHEIKKDKKAYQLNTCTKMQVGHISPIGLQLYVSHRKDYLVRFYLIIFVHS